MPEQSPGPTVSFDGVIKRYGDGAAVDGVTLDIAGGSFVALVGTSGSGKSTLLKTVNRLVVPDAGRVAIDGRDVADDPPARLRRRIGYVFQNVGLFPHLSVGDNIAMPLVLAGRRDPARVAAMLDLVELPRAFATRMPAELSGGQRQRVGVARALAAEARLLLMDEPFGALDPVTREALAGAIRRLHADLSLTTIMVTHDMAEALLNATRVLVMQAGRIVADAAPAAMLAGQAGAAADALVAVPRAQAERLTAMTR
ncbi:MULTISPECIES: ATP-binding cassette domain-containing protein [Sphingomonas]|uniref:ABC transporter ATP-binding protein n=2 Tax=Sphingomonas adhaesiva TaxID=28212 RepID=A0A2A4I8Q3_9SPHN|nr:MULTISPECIES: ATP-binding cassette domain-containing protein [Sphingomonas]PCG14384.1 ABC transporter ATP-binding protein [Sphingomonas adhaesiva]PZU73924.1 MAG: ABC transporter ATP-binding protein [Sphingomonas sp.]